LSAANRAVTQLWKEETLMAKLLGPDFISLQVRNLSASRTFYMETLGFAVDSRFDTPDFVLFDASTIPFALSEAKVNLDEAPHPGWGVTLWIDCDNVNELHAKLEAAGATIIKLPFDGPFGRTFVFADPDGYQITANENPWERFPLGGRQQD
jgi:predicted enzyme related to lactoylglutathione lyase